MSPYRRRTRECQAFRRILVEQEVFVAVAVVNAVDHDGQALHLRMPASRATRVKDDRTGIVLRQSSFDFPYQLLAFFLVGLHRLLIDQLVDLRIAVAGYNSVRSRTRSSRKIACRGR